MPTTEIVTYLDRDAQEACATSDEGYVRVPVLMREMDLPGLPQRACLYAAQTLAYRRNYGPVDPNPIQALAGGFTFTATFEGGIMTNLPAVVTDYFDRAAIGDHPVVAQVFGPQLGWTSYPSPPPLSEGVVLGLRDRGVTAVALQAGGHRADFQVAELIPPGEHTWLVRLPGQTQVEQTTCQQR